MLNPEAIANAVGRLGCLAKFPASDGARLEIMRLLERIVSTEAQLEWLVLTLIDHVGEWHGTKELRAVFCTRFRPKDGIEEFSALPGFTASDIEAENTQKLPAVAEAPRLGSGLRKLLQ